MVLTVTKLGVQLSGRTVLTDVNFHLPAGSLTALLGPNGAGKTTLLRAILGVQKHSGHITRTTTQVGYVPQRHDFAWDFPISVFDVVLTGFTTKRSLLKAPNSQQLTAAKDALVRTGMAKYAKRPVGELSGGQRQRVLIARALAAQPQLLLLDEPFTGLDQPTADSLLELLQQLAREGRTVLLVTHDLITAQARCDQLILLRGTVRGCAAPAVLRQTTAWQETFEVAVGHPLLTALGVTGVPGVPGVQGVTGVTGVPDVPGVPGQAEVLGELGASDVLPEMADPGKLTIATVQAGNAETVQKEAEGA